MSNTKPSIPKGMRDFTSEVMFRRNYIFETVKSAFECYGYAPIETPAMENISLLNIDNVCEALKKWETDWGMFEDNPKPA